MAVYTPPHAREVVPVKQSSGIQDYWRARLADFPQGCPPGFDGRWWDMLSRHVLDGESMADLAEEYGVSKGRVQTLLGKAHAKMKEVAGGDGLS